MPRANRVAPGLTGYFIRRNWRWVTTPGCGSSAKCTNCALVKSRRNDVASNSFVFPACAGMNRSKTETTPVWSGDWWYYPQCSAHSDLNLFILDLKQRRDQENFVAYQQQEKQRFDGHQQQEFEAFTRQQQWRLNAWKQAVARSPGQKPPPPPWDMPAGAQMMPPVPGPMGGPPPWMRPPGPGHRRS